MERRNLALLCAGVVCFWLFALAFGTAQGRGLRIQPAVQTQAEPAAQTLTVTPLQLTLPCRAAILIDQTSGAVLYEMNADQTMPIASITKVMTLLLTFEAVHAGRLTICCAVSARLKSCVPCAALHLPCMFWLLFPICLSVGSPIGCR